MFDTYGPFVLQSHDNHGIDTLFGEIDKDEAAGLIAGMGVYILATKNEKGTLQPLYVGRSIRSFGKRLKEHFKSGKFREFTEDGPLSLFLLARAAKGEIRPANRSTERDKETIAHLEFLLIGTCLKLNSKLQNRQLKRFYESFHVPGYIDNGAADRSFDAAKSLSKLLKT